MRIKLVALAFLLGVAACGDDDNDFELIGEWSSAFSDETITATMWNADQIIEFDNEANVVITQTSSSSMFFANLFNKIEYTEPANDAFFYCTTLFGQPSAEVARTSTQTADATDPATGGCAGFAWTELTRK